MKHRFGKWGILVTSVSLLALLLTLWVPVLAAKKENPLLPHAKPGGMKYRIGYCETEPFVNYSGTLYALIRGLEKYGWVKTLDGMPYTEGQSETAAMWDYLATHDVSPYIQFVPDAHYSLSTLEPTAGDRITNRLANQKDIDLMIVMGTKAGKTLATDKHKTPVMVFSTSNAVLAGIVKDINVSGNDHIWAHTDPERYQRQIIVFHDIFQFKRLGLVYENNEAGKIYAAVDDAKVVAREQGFKLVTEPVEPLASEADRERYYRDMLALHQTLANQVDAYYLTMSMIEPDHLPGLLQPFYDKKIPVFSQLGSEEVTAGALMSVARADFSDVGEFGAEGMIKMLNGVSAQKIPQLLQSTPNIALSLEVAKKIGYQPSFEILLAADEIYTKIDTAMSAN
ncbi:MAG: ABC transporter substrate binding protein [Solirubrobacterales bacterium]